MAEYLQRGESLDYVNAGDAKIEAGEVIVFGDRIGIAGCDIEIGATGSLHVVGVFVLPSGGAAFDQGEEVFWDGSAIVASGDTKAGFVAKAATAEDETVLVKINA